MSASSINNQKIAASNLPAPHAEGNCQLCGQPCEESICAVCADRIRAEALANELAEAPKQRSKPVRRTKAKSTAG
jgi:recombinational DNA repair protein RecR